MYIFEVIKPGTWLVSDDREWSWEVEGLLRHLESQFFEANLTLNMFLQSCNQRRNVSTSDQWEIDSKRRSEIRKEIEKHYDNPYEHKVWDEIHLETEIRFKREKWQGGQLPREFIHNQSFIYARAFLYALDSFDKFLKVLKDYKNTPLIIKELHDELGEIFPDLRAVRNSAQHMEDRARGLGAGRNPKKLDLKPIDNQLIKSDSGALMLNCLNGSKYGNTMSDGHYGEVDISPESMENLHSIFIRLLNAFEWKGPKDHLPSI